MTESLRSDEPNPGDFDVLPVIESESVSHDLSPAVVIEQFLTQCRHSSLPNGEQLGEFILGALNSTPGDEWTRLLQEQKIDPDDDQYDHLLNTDEVYFEMFDWALFTKKIVGRGEAMSTERKAFMQLWKLRAGERLLLGEATDPRHDEAWRSVIDKLFRDKLYSRYDPDKEAKEQN